MAGEITTGDAINSIANGVEWKVKIKFYGQWLAIGIGVRNKS